jgi:hypothetical protein
VVDAMSTVGIGRVSNMDIQVTGLVDTVNIRGLFTQVPRTRLGGQPAVTTFH